MCAIDGFVTAFGTHGGSITRGIREGHHRYDGVIDAFFAVSKPAVLALE